MGNVTSLKKGGIHKEYTLGDKLGEGSFAVVKQIRHKKTKELFACKIIKKSKLQEAELAILHDEVDIMHKIEHENCVRLYEIYESKKKLYMVLELLTGGELFDRILEKGSYSEKEASMLMKNVVGAIKYLHSIGIAHRDLKPENLIYAGKPGDKNENVIKITDFGLAKYKESDSASQKMHTACGTPGYVAPEVLKNDPYGFAVDLWSMGVILYILLCGFPPFYHQSTAQLYKQIKKGAYDFPAPYWDEISDEAKDLVKKLLTVNPQNRATPDEVLEHPWVASGKASAKALDSSYIDNMNLLVARRDFRKGVRQIIAVNRFANTIKALVAETATRP